MEGACVLPERVAAIEFGTGSCSLAYTLAKNGIISHISLVWARSPDSVREPTAILLKKNPDGTLEVVNFGSRVQEEVLWLNSKSLKQYLYFEFFKMNLFHKTVSASS